jgi:hypothetical protein
MSGVSGGTSFVSPSNPLGIVTNLLNGLLCGLLGGLLGC